MTTIFDITFLQSSTSFLAMLKAAGAYPTACILLFTVSNILLGLAFLFYVNYRKNRMEVCRIRETLEDINKKFEVSVYERERYKKMLRKAKEELSNGREFRYKLMTNLNHELRTPLNSIVGISNLITSDMQNGSKKDLKYYAEVLNASSTRLLSLFEKIMDIDQVGMIKKQIDISSIPVVELMSDIITKNKNKVEKQGLKIEMDIGFTPNVLADLGALIKVFDSIVDNAIKFTYSGNIRISTGFNQKLQEVFVKISDTGIGIDKEYLPMVFDSFSQENMNLTRKEAGIGLGLSQVKKLLEIMGGRVEIKSEKHSGTEVSVFLLPELESMKV